MLNRDEKDFVRQCVATIVRSNGKLIEEQKKLVEGTVDSMKIYQRKIDHLEKMIEDLERTISTNDKKTQSLIEEKRILRLFGVKKVNGIPLRGEVNSFSLRPPGPGREHKGKW